MVVSAFGLHPVRSARCVRVSVWPADGATAVVMVPETCRVAAFLAHLF